METSPVLQVVTKDNLNKEKEVLPQEKEGGGLQIKVIRTSFLQLEKNQTHSYSLYR